MKNLVRMYGPRILADVVLVIVSLSAPWWFTVILGIVATLLLPFYIEIIVFGWLLDFVYGGVRFEISALLLVIISFFVRKRVQFLNASNY